MPMMPNKLSLFFLMAYCLSVKPFFNTYATTPISLSHRDQKTLKPLPHTPKKKTIQPSHIDFSAETSLVCQESTQGGGYTCTALGHPKATDPLGRYITGDVLHMYTHKKGALQRMHVQGHVQGTWDVHKITAHNAWYNLDSGTLALKGGHRLAQWIYLDSYNTQHTVHFPQAKFYFNPQTKVLSYAIVHAPQYRSCLPSHTDTLSETKVGYRADMGYYRNNTFDLKKNVVGVLYQTRALPSVITAETAHYTTQDKILTFHSTPKNQVTAVLQTQYTETLPLKRTSRYEK